MRALLPAAAAVLALAIPSGGAAFGEPRGSEPGPAVCVLPPRDLSDGSRGVATVRAELSRALLERGFEVRNGEGVERHLREQRIRTRDCLTRDQAAGLAKALGCQFILLATITGWTQNGGPEVGLSARILDPRRGVTLWADNMTLHSVEAPGLLALGRPRTLEAASREAVDGLFDSLVIRRSPDGAVPATNSRKPGRSFLADRPVFFRSAELDRRAPLRIALLPFANRTHHPEGTSVVTEHMLSWLLTMPGVEVVDPGRLRDIMIEQDIQPYFGLGPVELAILRRVVEADAVLDGALLLYENGSTPTPRIDLYARLRDTRSGELLWSAAASREGDRTRAFYDIGRIRGMDRLADAAVSDLLATLIR